MGFPAAAVGAAVLAVVVAAALASLPPLVVAEVSGPHIAELNVLLPPRMTNPVGYRLQGSDGCFSWYTSFVDTSFFPTVFWNLNTSNAVTIGFFFLWDEICIFLNLLRFFFMFFFS